MKVGFSGKMRSGKDTAARYFRQRSDELADQGRGKPALINGLAIQLKRLCHQLEFEDGQYTQDFVDRCQVRYNLDAAVKRSVELKLIELDREFSGQSVGGKNRRLLQEVAEYLRADVSPNVWVDLLIDTVRQCEAWCDFLVPDVRKPHEVDDLRKAGFKIIRINVSPEVQRRRILEAGERYDSTALSFYTEVALDDYTGFDAVIQNDGTLVEFQHELDTVLANAYR